MQLFRKHTIKQTRYYSDILYYNVLLRLWDDTMLNCPLPFYTRNVVCFVMIHSVTSLFFHKEPWWWWWWWWVVLTCGSDPSVWNLSAGWILWLTAGLSLCFLTFIQSLSVNTTHNKSSGKSTALSVFNITQNIQLLPHVWV